MTSTANLASDAADTDTGQPAKPAAEAGPFVLNLCSSTTPMALAQTDLPELKRFTFFVSRRFEEGRERFRLHMGFFASLAEAEEWLGLVREVYPGAWAGEAPGKKLRARAAAAAAAQARHAVGPQPSLVSEPSPSQATRARKAPQSPGPQPRAPAGVPSVVPTLHPPEPSPDSTVTAAPPRPAGATSPAAQRPAAHAAVSRAASPTAMRDSAKAAPAAPRSVQSSAVTEAAAARATPTSARPGGSTPNSAPGNVTLARPAPARSAAAPPAGAAAARKPAGKPVFADSNVKEVLAALDQPGDSTGETRVMPALPMPRGADDDGSLTDTQVLKFLEARREEGGTPPRLQRDVPADAAAESGISLLKPDDTGTRRALKEAVSHNQAVSFAVQLHWSVQPVELEKVPPLAIFSAYTLYSVEGSREGRKWYGLRLGFFNDAISAKQVAYYVRSEFASVAVVPVSPQERERATEDNQRFSGVGPPRRRRATEENDFKLFDSGTHPAPDVTQTAPPTRASPASSPAAREERKGPGKVGARERRTPQTLEETLEILGANELAIDNGSRESLNDNGVRHLRVQVQKNTPFSRLLERLSERVRKS